MNHRHTHSKDKIALTNPNGENPEFPINASHEGITRKLPGKNSMDRHEILPDEIEDSICELDLRGNITFVNKATCQISKSTKEQMIGLNYRSWLDKDNQQKVYDIYSKVYKTGITDRYSHEVNWGGRNRVLEDTVSAIRNAQGEIIGFRTISRDITERRKVEKELAEHRSRLDAIFSSVNEAIVTVDMNAMVTIANHSTETICGVNVREMVGKPLAQCLPLCSRSCGDLIRQTIEKKSTIREHRIECAHQQRQQQLVSVTSAPLRDANGDYLGAVLVVRDITLLRDLEKELRERHQFQNIIGRSKKMQNLYRLLEDLANLETTVLLTGESGTGKELVARALHYSGQRAIKPFVAVNCSALTESLLESELFGHVKGAFTGAIKDKQGRFQAANGGTLLLDEIGDISPIIQLKLLRVLQEKTFEKVGDSEPQKVDVRVIASTNKNLKDKVRLGEFREDLYYRLKVVEVTLPPLRDRLEDIPLLIDHLCRVFNERFNKSIEGLSKEVLHLFMGYPWPGNIRELEHVIEHAFIICHGPVIVLEDLPSEFQELKKHRSPADSTHRAQTATETSDIIAVLDKVHWNKTQAAHLLGIHRRTIHRKINQLKIKKNT